MSRTLAAGGRRAAVRQLHELARMHGVQTTYTSIEDRTVRASVDALLGVLGALRAPVATLDDVPDALRERRIELWRRPIEPVTTAWGGRLPPVRVRLPSKVAARRLRLHVAHEDGSAAEVPFAVPTMREERVDGRSFVEQVVHADVELPFGYHRLIVEAPGVPPAETLVISSPQRAPRAPGTTWGAFLPLYALRSDRSWGVGDLTDLANVVEWVASLGGSVVATLPLQAAFLSEPFEPSPYSPSSRLFWNELYLDVTAVPELGDSAGVRRALSGARTRREVARLQSRPLVDYEAAAALKRGILEPIARSFFDRQAGPRWSAFRAFLRMNPAARDYARFMATCDRHGKPWTLWPAAERDGRLPADVDGDPAYPYHLFVQWQMAEQMAGFGRRASEAGAGLYLDAPLGVHQAGYDVWRERDAFATRASAGAPPDPLFAGGQEWGFHPLHPEAIREQGYRYPIACLRHLLQHATVLRIDHQMGLHRLFWVPRGFGVRDGMYVRYRAEELYAILTLESHRTGTVVVGEDLGIVPNFVRQAMRRHGLYRSFVVQMEVKPDPGTAIARLPAQALASVNTHDMPPFAGFWRGDDIRLRQQQGWLDREEARLERERRARLRIALIDYLRAAGRLAAGASSPGEGPVLRAVLEHLAGSDARMMVVNLEDLWSERRPQNVPGTTNEFPNWRRPARYRFEEFRHLPSVTRTLRRIDGERKRGEHR
jgi:4-alpha-glucanotransferase